MAYIRNIAIAANQLANALMGGWPDETLSARAHRRHLRGRSHMRELLNILHFWQRDHCRAAYEAGNIRRRMSPDCR